MAAAYRGNLEVVKKLMSLRADMYIITTNDNWTAFGFAVGLGHLEVAKYFLPSVKLREYTLRERSGQKMREVVLDKVARIPKKPYLDILELLNKSYEEMLAAVCLTTGQRIPKKL